jgi:hypothetical protein
MKTNLIKRRDYNRVLITETLPFETPIIFSNDGLYDLLSTLDTADEVLKVVVCAIVFGTALPKKVNSTEPYLYKVKKSSYELRRLALLHPSSQWKLRCFYEKYERLMLHYCYVSPASIRTPRRIAGSFYSKSSWENINQYKNGAVTTTALDKYVKHTPSYFAYKGHDRLYKFFNSRDYFALEKQFSVLTTLDVSKCFDSIYTHSLSWAVKDKSFTKANVAISSTFAQEFDEIIRHGNHNETNGIPIGPETSRIFAEIIFQEIDRRTIHCLSELGEKFGVHYTFRRYVDDVFIFTRDEKTGRKVYAAYADVLTGFNLHANTSKSHVILRPFLTAKSRIIFEAGHQANTFFEKFLNSENRKSLVPKEVYSQWSLTKSYLDSIKSLCSSSSANYDEISSFLISVITERVKKLVTNGVQEIPPEEQIKYLATIEVLLDVLFFLYSVAPSVSASYKLSTSIILLMRFSRRHLQPHIETVAQRIYDLLSSMLIDQCGVSYAEGIEGFVRLEYLNVVLAARELGPHYLLPLDVVEKMFINEKLTYFTIISCLFYIRDEPRYKSLKKTLLKEVRHKLNNLADVFHNSEKAHLLLDLLFCPFVAEQQKTIWMKGIFKVLGKAQPGTPESLAFVAALNQRRSQVDWADVDLLNSLEKKELKRAY